MCKLFTLKEPWQNDIHPSFFFVQFKPSATSKKHYPALEKQTVSKVFGLERNIEVFSLLYFPEKLQKTLTFLVAREVFPRVRLVSNMNIDVSKFICNLNQLSDRKSSENTSLTFIKFWKDIDEVNNCRIKFNSIIELQSFRPQFDSLAFSSPTS